VTAYRRGVRAEKFVVERLSDDGYVCIESRGSHGPADVWAAKVGELLFIQVKLASGSDWPLSHGAWNALREAARLAGAIPVVAIVTPGRPHHPPAIACRKITGRHAERSQLWPSEPFVIDVAGAAAE